MFLLILFVLFIVLLPLYLFYIFPQQVKGHRSDVVSSKGEEVPSTNPFTPLTDVIGLANVPQHFVFMNRFFNFGMFQKCFLYQWWVNLFDSSLIGPLLFKPEELFDRDLSKLGILSDFFGKSLINVSGDDWKRQHRIVLKAFTPSNINRFIPVLVNGLHTRAVPKIEEMMKEKGKVDVNLVFQGMAIDLIIQVGFASDPKETAELRDLFEICREAFEDPLYTLPFYRQLNFIPSVKRTNNAMKRMNELASFLIEKRRKYLKDRDSQEKGSEPESETLSNSSIRYIIDLLLEAHDDETNTQLTDIELRDNALLFLLAGSETTAVSMLWFVHNILSYDQQIYQRLQEEIDRVIPADPTNITFQHIANLSYFNHVLHESMRVTPAVSQGAIRILRESTQIGDWLFKKGSEIVVNIVLTHMNPNHYPNPEKFDPERWVAKSDLGASSESNEKDLAQVYFQAGKYAPFGSGRRICIGKNFAYMEMRIALAYLLRMYKISIPKDEKFPKQALIRLPTYFPIGGLHAVFERR